MSSHSAPLSPRISFPDSAYSLEAERSQFHSALLRFAYESLKTPPSTFDYDMTSGSRQLKKKKEVLGGFDETKYETVRKWASASDGTQVPISLLYRKDLVKLDGTDPCHLYGYGSYEVREGLPASCCCVPCG